MSPANNKTEVERSLSAEIKLYYDLKLPEILPAPLLIALHGYGASKRHMMREVSQMAPDGFAIASLQGFHQHMKEPKEPGGPLRFGFGWLTNFHPEESVAIHHKALLDLIKSLTGEGIANAQRIFLLGFSQSCALNYRFAFTHPDSVRGVIGMCGGVPGDLESSDLYRQTKASVLHLSGVSDQFYPLARVADYAQRLERYSQRVVVKSYEAGHEFVPPMRKDVHEWLQRCLDD